MIQITMKSGGQIIEQFKTTRITSQVNDTFTLQKIRGKFLVDIRYIIVDVHEDGDNVTFECNELSNQPSGATTKG